MKKADIIAIINLLAFVGIFSLIREQFGKTFEWRLFIPSVLIFSTYLSMVRVHFSKKDSQDDTKEDDPS